MKRILIMAVAGFVIGKVGTIAWNHWRWHFDDPVPWHAQPMTAIEFNDNRAHLIAFGSDPREVRRMLHP